MLEDGGNDGRNELPDDPRVRYFLLDGEATVGAKRNIANREAAGNLIVHWDDDDWSFPGRIAEQVDSMVDGVQLSGYHSMYFWDCDSRQSWLYSGQSQYALGTSMCYRKAYWLEHPFPELQVGEDNYFLAQARRYLFSIPAEHRMVASIHSGNSSQRQLHITAQWKKVDASLLPAEAMC